MSKKSGQIGFSLATNSRELAYVMLALGRRLDLPSARLALRFSRVTRRPKGGDNLSQGCDSPTSGRERYSRARRETGHRGQRMSRCCAIWPSTASTNFIASAASVAVATCVSALEITRRCLSQSIIPCPGCTASMA